MKQAELYISEGLHPRVVTEGFEEGKKKALEILEEMKIKITDEEQRDVLTKIASTSLKTKIHPKVFSLFISYPEFLLNVAVTIFLSLCSWPTS